MNLLYLIIFLSFLAIILLYFFAFPSTINLSKLYSKKMAQFAKEQNFDFTPLKIDLFRSYLFQKTIYKPEYKLKKILFDSLRGKGYIFPYRLNEYSFDRDFYNFMGGIYKSRKVQIYNSIASAIGMSNSSITCCQVSIKPIKGDIYLEEKKFSLGGQTPGVFRYLEENPQDINLEYHDFNKKYLIQCEEPELAFQILDPVLMNELMKYEYIAIEISHDSLIIASEGELDPDQILKNLDAGIRIAGYLDKADIKVK